MYEMSVYETLVTQSQSIQSCQKTEVPVGYNNNNNKNEISYL